MKVVTRPPRPVAPDFRLYIDETGDHTYRKLERPGQCHLALLGVWFEQETAYPAFVQSLDRLKRDYLGGTPDEPVLLHRKEIVGRKGAFSALLDPDCARGFDDALLRLVDEADFTMVCVIIDKKRHQEQYVYPFHPYHYSLTCMLERYCRWLGDRAKRGDVWAECRGKEEDGELEGAYRSLWTRGGGYLKAEVAQRCLTSKSIKLRTKAHNIAGLQLADLLAHPVKVESLVEQAKLKDPGPYFGRELAAVAAKKFRRCGHRINGYGRVFL